MSIPDALKTTMNEFIAELKDIFTDSEETADLILIEFFFNKLSSEQLMNHCVVHILPWKTHIKDKNVDFFIKNKKIFAGLPEDRVNYFSNMWKGKNSKLTEEDKDVMWQYMDSILESVIIYKKNC